MTEQGLSAENVSNTLRLAKTTEYSSVTLQPAQMMQRLFFGYPTSEVSLSPGGQEIRLVSDGTEGMHEKAAVPG